MIDVAGGDDIPRKRGPGVLRCDLLVVNDIDLAPFVGVDLDAMLAEARAVREGRPILATNARTGARFDLVPRRCAQLASLPRTDTPALRYSREPETVQMTT